MNLPPFSPVSPYSQRNNMPSVRQYIEMVSVLIHLRFPHEVHLPNHPKEIPKRNTPKNTPKEITSKKYPKEIPQRNTLKKCALNSACRQHYLAGGLERSPPPFPLCIIIAGGTPFTPPPPKPQHETPGHSKNLEPASDIQNLYILWVFTPSTDRKNT